MTVRMSTGFAAQILGPTAFEQVFRYGCVEIRSGLQPDSADLPPTGVLLARITRDGGAWTAGVSDNGLEFDRSGRYAMKRADHLWRLVGLAEGQAGWFRMLPNASDTGAASLTAPRIDGLVGLEGVEADIQLYLPTLAITPSTDIAINHWWFALPPIGE